MSKSKTPKESHTILTNLILPGETNVYNNMFGGELLSRMDRVASISARKHSGRQTMTASVNHVSFKMPIPVGSIVRLEAKVSRAFNTSMEVVVDVWIDYVDGKASIKSNEGIYTFVSIDKNNLPQKVPRLKPETKQEKKRYKEALLRKELSLIMGGRKTIEESNILNYISN